jgi:hypothetical protein
MGLVCHTFRDEYRLRAFEKRVLRKVFGPSTGEVSGEWRRLHNEERYDLYSSPYIIRVIKPRRMGWAGHVVRMGDRRGAYGVLVGRPDGKRAFGRRGRRWEDNTKMYLQNVWWRSME